MVIGVTGNFGAGKTTVARMFVNLGARVIDADKIAHGVIRPGNSIHKRIVACFGRRILVGNHINRRKLADVVFSDKKNLKILNNIMHPEILRIIKNRLKESSESQIIVIDAALLIESGLLPWINKLVVVKSEPRIQIERLKKCGVGVKEINRRLGVQLPQRKKINYADFVINNSGRRSQTKKQVKEIWYKIKRGGAGWKN